VISNCGLRNTVLTTYNTISVSPDYTQTPAKCQQAKRLLKIEPECKTIINIFVISKAAEGH